MSNANERAHQLVREYVQAAETGDDERKLSILAIALTHPDLEDLIWQAECEAAATEIASVTDEDLEKVRIMIQRWRNELP